MTDEAPVRYVASFCNAEHLIKTRHRKANYKTIYEFDLENDRAFKLLNDVYPFLICKKGAADLAIALRTFQFTSRSHRTKVVGVGIWGRGNACGSQYRKFGMSDEYLSFCDNLYQKAKRINPRSGGGEKFHVGVGH